MAKKTVARSASESSKGTKSSSSQHKHKDPAQEPSTSQYDTKKFAARGLSAAIEARRQRQQADEASLFARFRRWLWLVRFRYDVLIGNYTFTSGEGLAVNVFLLLVLALLFYGAVQQLRLIAALPQLRVVRDYLRPAPQRSTS